MKALAPQMGESYITIAALAPLRAEPADASEMVSQLLFGDLVELIDAQRQWRRVRVLADGYEGWVDEKAIEAFEAQDLPPFSEWPWVSADQISVQWGRNGEWASRRISLGARIPLKNGEQACKIGPWELQLPEAGWQHSAAKDLVGLSAQYLGAPYLWGGKSLWGIDCSGFSQMVFGLCGIQLPRDAWQQAELGLEIAFENRQEGDLAFFANDKGRVIHVGIILAEDGIRHAHGSVRDDRLNAEGIQNKFTGIQTHKLCSIKRFV